MNTCFKFTGINSDVIKFNEFLNIDYENLYLNISAICVLSSALCKDYFIAKKFS